METKIEIQVLQQLKPGYLKKLEQIMKSGLLDVCGDVGEIHFDKDGNIRKIKVPKVSLFP